MKTKTQFTNRILSLVLSIMVVVSMLPASALSVLAADTTYPYAVVDTEAGTVTIDGTLGGKTDATEEDLTALVAALKSYVESGHTTIIVTGSQPAKLLMSGYLTPVVSLAFEELTRAYQSENIDSYWGTVDLIYQDVTEIVEYEFYVCDVLKSITLPKVTTVGDSGFWACHYLETLTFGSVVTAINDNSGEVFYDLGYKIDGCNLVLNCGQLQAATEYQPNLSAKTWWKDNEWKSITLGAHVSGSDGTCDCGASVVAEVEYGDTATYYATLTDALVSALYGTDANVYALTDCNDDFTIPASVFFYGGDNSFGGKVTNNGDIREGTFNGEVTNEYFIHGGTFNATVINHEIIDGGTFNGNVTNYDRISNDFDADRFILGDYFTIENHGTISCDYHHWKDGVCRLCAYACTHAEGTAATCTTQAVCENCGASYGEVGGHALTYTANGNTITASCSANCGYSETATISAEDTTYNGTEQKTATVTYSDGWKSDELNVSYENNGNAGTATASITVGEATAAVDFTIAKATVTVTADAKIKSYGDEDPSLTYTAEGLLGGDTLTSALTGALTREEGENVGSYAITLGTLSADNYIISFVGADFTIQAKEVTDPIVTLDQTSYQYDGNVKEPKVTSIVVDGRTLIEGTDYTVSYEDNVYVNTEAKVVINFMGNYDGTFKKWFTITQDPDTTEFDGEWVTIPKG